MTSLENMYRGPIYEDFDFYLAARLNPGISSPILGSSGLNLNINNNDPVFLLCLNRFEEHGQEKHRLYWSNDTNDFVLNPLDNSQNQGAVIMNFKKNVNDYNLYYKTQLNYNKNNHFINKYAVDNNFNINDISNNFPSTFNIIPASLSSRNGPANISDVIYTSLEYHIFSGEDYIDWIFRGTSTPNFHNNPDFITSGPSISHKPDTDFNKYFQTCNTVGVSLKGSGLSAFYNTAANNYALGVSFLHPIASGLSFPDIPETGILQLTSGSTIENIRYNNFDLNTKTFYFKDEGTSYFDTYPIQPPNTTDTYGVTVNIRNDARNFKRLSEIVPDGSTYKNSRPEALEIFFVPVARNSYFAPGETLDHVDLFTPTNINDEHIYFFDYESGLSTLNDRSLLYFTNFIQATLPGTLTYEYMPNLPKIPIPYTAGTTSFTALIWSDFNEAHNPYKYDYCRNDELCGDCMGLTSNRAFYCHAHDGTLAAYAPGGLGGENPGTGAQSKPLSSNKLELDIILEIVFLIILLISIVVVIFFVVKERNNYKAEESKIIAQV